MLTLISCAKLMQEHNSPSQLMLENYANFTTPKFQHNAEELAQIVAKYNPDELAQTLKINAELAAQNYMRYQIFGRGEQSLTPAIVAYNGIVFKNIDPDSLNKRQITYAQNHLLITSFLYGLLRPLDLIEPYRLEGKFKLQAPHNSTIFEYWRTKLTDILITQTKACGGTLCNLASREMQELFDWKRVCQQVRVITPEFQTLKGDKLKTLVVYTKIARGKMTREIISKEISSSEQLMSFSECGYRYSGEISDKNLLFIKY